MKTKFNMSRLLALSLASIFLLTATMSMTALADSGSTTVIPYGDSGYKYQVVSTGLNAGFESTGFDDSNFLTGDAGFGSIYSGCLLTSSEYVKTSWALNSDILVRKEFYLPEGTSNLKVYIAIDNDVQVFINGQDVSSGMKTHEGCPSWNSFEFSVDDSVLNSGTNLIAVRGRDRGTASFLDIKVTADVPPASEEIPEFPTIALPMAAIIGLAFIFKRK
ncbi:PEF-CTERM sorting domain-containing protein [Methanolobus psychrotolerans]|uniref:PEF-CTERM sorting domain-containing protein n=1 Tax=Methanolobus psychrotolerans TaxID=1874706 RepID=UPI000B91CC11|nr:PEF-CTERM sorting domain-containing protein [Methanolobus psychrotolerans]